MPYGMFATDNSIRPSDDINYETPPDPDAEYEAVRLDGIRRGKRRGRLQLTSVGYLPSSYAELLSMGGRSPQMAFLASQSQPDQYGWGWGPVGSPITASSAYGPALAHGGQGPGRGYGPAYLNLPYNATMGITPGGYVNQQDVGMRAAEAARAMRSAILRMGFSYVKPALWPARTAQASGATFRVDRPAELGQIKTVAIQIAQTANLHAVLAPRRNGTYSIYFTDVPSRLHVGMPRDIIETGMEQVSGFDDGGQHTELHEVGAVRAGAVTPPQDGSSRTIGWVLVGVAATAIALAAVAANVPVRSRG